VFRLVIIVCCCLLLGSIGAQAEPKDVKQLRSLLGQWPNTKPGEARDKLAQKLSALADTALDKALTKKPESPKDRLDMQDLALQALAARQAVFGEQAIETIVAEYDLARVYEINGRISELKEHLLHSYDLVARVFPEHLAFALISTKMGVVFADRGSAVTDQYFDRAAQVYQNQFGADSLERAHLLVARARANTRFSSGETVVEQFDEAVAVLQRLPETDAVLLRGAIVTARLFRMGLLFEMASVEEYENAPVAVAEWLAINKRQSVPCVDSPQTPTEIPIRPLALSACDAGMSQFERETMLLWMSGVIMMTGGGLVERWLAVYDELLGSRLPDQLDLARLVLAGEYDKASRMLKVFGGLLVKQYGQAHPLIANYLGQLARLEQWQGNEEEAARLNRLAMAIYLQEAPTEISPIISLMTQLGTYAARTGEYADANRYFNASEQLIAKNPSVESLVATSNEGALSSSSLLVEASSVDRGYLYFLMGNFEQARQVFEDDLPIKENKQVAIAQMLARLNLSNFYGALNDHARAAVIIDVERLYPELNEMIVEETRNGRAAESVMWTILLARSEFYNGRFSSAEKVLRACIENQKKTSQPEQVYFADLYRDLAMVLMAKQDYQAARPVLEQLIEHPTIAGNVQKSAMLKVQMGQAYLRTGNHQGAIPLFEEALVDLTLYGNDMTLWNAEAMMSEAMMKEGNTAAAIYFGKLAVNRLQSLRAGLEKFSQPLQVAFLGDKEFAYRTLADALVESGDLPQAQQVVAMLKQHEYENFLQTRTNTSTVDVLSFKPAEEKVATAYTTRSRELVQLNQDIRKLRTRKREGKLTEAEGRALKKMSRQFASARKMFSNEISTIRKEFANLDVARVSELGEKHLGSLGALQGSVKRLGADVALVHYLLLPDKVRIIVTTSSQQTSIVSPVPEKTLNQLVFDWRDGVENIDEDLNITGQALFHHLVEPIDEILKLENIKTIMVSLDGVLRYLPLAALHDGNGYLAERYQFALFTPAARSAIERQPRKDWSVAAFGVSLAAQGYAPLPAVPLELNGIVRVGDDDEGVLPGMVVLDEDFTKERFSDVLSFDGDYPVIHIASHFDFVAGHQSDSSLLTGNGGLSIDEFQFGDYPLHNVDLLTLSACNSGLSGIDANGAEIEGLATLAQNKGAAAVMATLWSVADASTGQFMNNFYQERMLQGSTKAEAIQATQRKFITGEGLQGSYEHPFFWAPFILMGNWL
jgi:CHAT domain-containing protein